MRVPTCLTTVIAELNRQWTGMRTKKDARKKKTGKRKLVKTVLEPFWISLPPPLHPPTIRKGRCSHRTVPATPAYHYPLTLHVSGPSIVLRAMPRSFTPPARLVLLLLSSPGLFTLPSSPVATLCSSIRAGQQPLRHPRFPSSLAVEAIWPLLHTGYIRAALFNYVRYFSSQGGEKKETGKRE